MAWLCTDVAANERTTKVAFRWTPIGRRKRVRPQTTWRRTVLKELEEMDQDLMGRNTKQSTGQGSVALYDCALMSQPGRKG